MPGALGRFFPRFPNLGWLFAKFEFAIGGTNWAAPGGPRDVPLTLPKHAWPQYLGDIGCPYEVITNDERTVDEIVASNPAGILLSPGPGTPDDSGVTMEVAARLGAAGYPIFGVCMGLQCIGQAAGGNIVRAPSGVMHGKASLVWHSDVGVLRGLPNPFRAARYHSLVIDKDTCPDSLEVTAWCEDGTIMAARHREHPNVEGVQFHPESIITENGMVIMKNFVDSLELHRMNVVA